MDACYERPTRSASRLLLFDFLALEYNGKYFGFADVVFMTMIIIIPFSDTEAG